MRTAIFVTIVAIFARFSFAVPPGCLLHAVNTQDEPSDLSAICGDGALDVQSYMADNCGKYEDTAQKAFIDTCSSAGTSVAAYTATSSSNSTTSTKSSSGTGLITSTTAHATGGSSSNSASASRSGSGSPISSTAGANVDYRQAALGPMAAAAVALIGAVAAL